jgi:hypothetical protein
VVFKPESITHRKFSRRRNRLPVRALFAKIRAHRDQILASGGGSGMAAMIEHVLVFGEGADPSSTKSRS